MNEPSVIAELQSLGFTVSSRGERRWSTSESYEEKFEAIAAELWQTFPLGGGGQEKLMATAVDLPYVVKIAGDPVHQHWPDGMQSLFEEHSGSLRGLNGHRVVAESLLLWHSSGAPVLVQEKLTNLTNRVPDELAKQLSWLPESWSSYAQIGQRPDGEWRIYDLDAGSTCDFYSQEDWDEVMAKLAEEYYERES